MATAPTPPALPATPAVKTPVAPQAPPKTPPRVAVARTAVRAATGVQWPYLVAGAGALGMAGLVIWKFKDIKNGVSAGADAVAQGANMIIGTIQSAAFNAIIPAAARPFADIIQREAGRVNVSPFLLVAIGIRETNWGVSSRPQGPSGTGDWAARHYSAATVAKLGAAIKLVSTLPSGWSPGHDAHGVTLTAPWYIPSDGLGWGRGLMQIDWAAHQDWFAQHDWRDPQQNISYAADVLAHALAYFARGSTATDDPRPFTGNDLLHAALAAYNAGEGGVLTAVKAGKGFDGTTTGANYGGAVLNTALTLQAMLG